MSSKQAKAIAFAISGESTNLGDIKKRGKEIKIDHELALELWSMGGYYPRLLSTLILDKERLNEDVIDTLAADMRAPYCGKCGSTPITHCTANQGASCSRNHPTMCDANRSIAGTPLARK